MEQPGFPERSVAIRRAVARFCMTMDWAFLHEVPLPNARRADVLALRPDGAFVCIEIKSGVRDFQTDQKWPEYRAFCDQLFFAVDNDFPLTMLPEETGLIVTAGSEADMLRDAPDHRLPPARRTALLRQFARLAAFRLSGRNDAEVMMELRGARRAE